MTAPDKRWSFFLFVSILLSPIFLPGLPIKNVQDVEAEICNNGEDDDGDGMIDLNDDDCICVIIEPESLVPNPSFEDMNCCPSNRSQLNCADVWIQASEPTTDYLHTCDWLGWENFPPPRPFPDGDGIMGFRDGRVLQSFPETNWKEYAGACLLGPLEANERYRFEFFVGFVDEISSPPINITFFGSTSCANLPFGVGNEDFGCPTNGPGWVRLGSSQVSTLGGSSWVKSAINVSPREDIHAIAIGPDCPATFSNQSTYYFFDNLVLADLRSFEFKIDEVEHPCSKDFTMEVPLEEGIEYQWYLEGIALPDERSHLLSKNYGEGTYQVRISNESGCNLTGTYTYEIPEFESFVDHAICEDDVYPFGPDFLEDSGDYMGQFLSRDQCDSVVYLSLEVIGEQESNMQAKIFEGETFEIGNYTFKNEGLHQAQLTSSLGCDSIVNVVLGFYELYFPNVFSPNGDKNNDTFSIYGNEDLKEIRNLTILDRWGTELFNGNDLMHNESDGWDGMRNGAPIRPGVYSYSVTVEMTDGISRQFFGDVLVIN